MSETAKGRTKSIASWVLQLSLGVIIAAGGAAKLAGDPAMVQLFDDIGAGQWLRMLVGALEALGGVGLLIPRVRALAALGLLTLLVAATATTVFLLDASPLVSLALAAVALAIALLRRHELMWAARHRPVLAP